MGWGLMCQGGWGGYPTECEGKYGETEDNIQIDVIQLDVAYSEYAILKPFGSLRTFAQCHN